MPTKQFGVDFDAATTPLDGTETLSIVQGGVTVDCTTDDIAALAGGSVTSVNGQTGAVSLSLDDLTDVDAAAPANGDVLTWNSTDSEWQPQAGGGGGSGAMTLVSTTTVSGSAQTSVTISPVDLATDGSYHILFSIANATASAATISMFYSGDTTATNYRNQTLAGFATSPSSARQNNAIIAEMGASSYVTGVIDILRDISGRPRANSFTNRDEPAAIGIQFFTHIRANTGNVTSITFTSSVASSIGIGSVFKVFKLN